MTINKRALQALIAAVIFVTATTAVVATNRLTANKPAPTPPSNAAINARVEPNPQEQTVSLVANGQTFSRPFRVGMSAYDLMAELRASKELDFDAKDYGPGMGYLIERIGDKKNDSAKNLFWILSVNGQAANAGVSSTKLKSGDAVSWDYRAWE